MRDVRRELPAVGTLLDSPELMGLLALHPRPIVTAAVRAAIDAARGGGAEPPDGMVAWARAVAAALATHVRPSLRPVLNGTGVVLHTNLGRAPLAAEALAALASAADGFCNLEYDVARGVRGSRADHCAGLLRELTGAEGALVVNNCAAALVLALNTLADGRDVAVSRGELVEIGGSFRVPDIMRRSGARLAEVGTTNRTHRRDYEQALDAGAAAIVKVHRSNFALHGFVAEVGVEELAALANDRGVPLMHDLGSGLLISLEAYGLAGELTARDAVAAGPALVLMSGDKLLGGPQAGIIVGRADVVAALQASPLARALRADKLTLAALEATLALYRDPAQAVRTVPALAMLTAPAAELRARADRLAGKLAASGVPVQVVASEATVGGGAFPTARIPSFALALGGDARAREQRLRAGALPVIGRIVNDVLLVDLRSVPAGHDERLAAALRAALA